MCWDNTNMIKYTLVWRFRGRFQNMFCVQIQTFLRKSTSRLTGFLIKVCGWSPLHTDAQTSEHTQSLRIPSLDPLANLKLQPILCGILQSAQLHFTCTIISAIASGTQSISANPLSPNSWSNANFSFQFMASYVWYTMDKLAGDLLLGLKFV